MSHREVSYKLDVHDSQKTENIMDKKTGLWRHPEWDVWCKYALSAARRQLNEARVLSTRVSSHIYCPFDQCRPGCLWALFTLQPHTWFLSYPDRVWVDKIRISWSVNSKQPHAGIRSRHVVSIRFKSDVYVCFFSAGQLRHRMTNNINKTASRWSPQ